MRFTIFLISILIMNFLSAQGKDSVTIKKVELIPILTFKEGKPDVLPSGDQSIQVLKYHFGKVGVGDSVFHEFWVKNTGTAPLIITNVVASCKCTVAYFSDGEIPVGEVGVIQSGFKIEEEGENHHTLTILTNTPSGTDFIELYYEGLKIERDRGKIKK